MFGMLDAKRIMNVAASIGIHLTEDEARLYQPVLVQQLRALDGFVQARLDEDQPTIRYPERERGYRPGSDEDTYLAWLWKCRIGGEDTGALAGKTVSFKDHISVAGIPQCFTSQVLEGLIPDVDATVVTRVLEAGAQVVGKHMMNGFVGDFGMPLNPRDRTRATGGSSSGSGAALAAGEVDISFGGDQGGSVRIPAAYCGIVGLKPTFGLISHFGAGFGAEQSVDHIGPMARRVEDVAKALQVVAGYDGYDYRQSREIPTSYDATSGLQYGIDGLRIGIVEEGFAEPIEPGVSSCVLAAIEVLEKAGASVTRVSIPEHQAMDAVYAALVIEGARAVLDTSFFGMWTKTYYPKSVITAIDKMMRGHVDLLPARTKLNHIAAELSRQTYHGAVYAKAQNVRGAYTRAYDKALVDCDLLALPTVRNVPPPVETPPEDPLEAVEANLRRNWMVMPMAYNTKPMDYTGHPALALPCGTADGLPVSLQLVGRHLDDALLLRAGYAFEESVDWESSAMAAS